MNDEREMILRMLKDGKISVAEAQALLGVLEEERDETGFSAAPAREATGDAGSTTARPGGDTEHAEHAGDREHAEDHHERHADEDAHEHRGDRGPFDFKIDLDGLSESVRQTMRGVSDALKGAFDGLADLDIGAEIHRAMGRNRAETERDATLSAEGATGFSVRNDWGDVRVTGEERSDVAVVARVSAWGASMEEAQQTLAGVTVSLQLDSDGIIVLKEGLPDQPRRRVRIDYEVRVPTALNLRAHTASGDLWIEGVTGTHQVSTASGDITIADARDALTLSSKSGDVVLGATEGNVTVSTLSGDISVNGFSGELHATTKSGDVRVEGASGQFTLKTLSGDVDLDVDALEGPLLVSAVSGSIRVTLPDQVAATLRAKTVTGEISCDLPLDAGANRTSSLVQATVSGGGTEVELSTVSGDVHLE